MQISSRYTIAVHVLIGIETLQQKGDRIDVSIIVTRRKHHGKF